MKYLKNLTEYKFLNETFENDITWGGSLLGRLINSTIRKTKIGYKSTKVSGLIKQLTEQIENLAREYANEEDSQKINKIVYKFLLEKIFNEVISESNIDEKLDILLGTTSIEGLIDTTISEIQKIELERKEELIDKLRKFKDDLLKINRNTTDNEEDEESDDESEKDLSKSDNGIKIFFDNTKNLLISVSKIHSDIKFNRVKFKSKEEKTDTFFDEKKYQQQKSNTINDVNKKISLIKNAIKIYTTKSNKERINFYKSELDKYTKKLKLLQSQSSTTKVRGEEKDVIDVSADKRAKEELGKLHTKPVLSESILIESNSDIHDVELDAKNAWNKVVNAYNKSGISKYITYIDSLINPEGVSNIKNSKKKILEIGRQIVINYSNIGSPISYQELISENSEIRIDDVAKSISLFARVLLAFQDDIGLLGSYGSSYKQDRSEAGGAGNHIKLFINSFKKIKDSYVGLKKESYLIGYSEFKIILESDNDEEDNINLGEDDDDLKYSEENRQDKTSDDDTSDDSVKKSWYKFFRKGEEKEWKINEKEVLEFNKEIEDKEIFIPNGKLDPIIRIVNIFGRAYDIYATDFIPSGRPNGRVSLKTMREYEHIGTGKPEWNSDRGPGFGPWAAKIVYDKWQNGVTKLLEDKKLRKVLANTKFVSDAETSTDTVQKRPGSGKTLFAFINDLLDNNDASFKKHRSILFKKYFGIEDKNIQSDIKFDTVTGNKIEDISKEDEGDLDKPFFTNEGISSNYGVKNIKIDCMIKFTTADMLYIMWPYVKKKVDGKEYLLFRYQVSKKSSPRESIITDCLEGKRNRDGDTFKNDYITEGGTKISYDDYTKVFVGGVDILDKNNKFSPGQFFKFKSIDIIEAEKGDFSDIKEYSAKIEKIEYLVVPEKDQKTNKQRKQKIQIKNVSKLGRNDRSMGKEKNDNLIKEFLKK